LIKRPTARKVLFHNDDPHLLKIAAGENVRIHLLFFVLLSANRAAIYLISG